MLIEFKESMLFACIFVFQAPIYPNLLSPRQFISYRRTLSMQQFVLWGKNF